MLKSHTIVETPATLSVSHSSGYIQHTWYTCSCVISCTYNVHVPVPGGKSIPVQVAQQCGTCIVTGHCTTSEHIHVGERAHVWGNRRKERNKRMASVQLNHRWASLLGLRLLQSHGTLEEEWSSGSGGVHEHAPEHVQAIMCSYTQRPLWGNRSHHTRDLSVALLHTCTDTCLHNLAQDQNDLSVQWHVGALGIR